MQIQLLNLLYLITAKSARQIKVNPGGLTKTAQAIQSSPSVTIEASLKVVKNFAPAKEFTTTKPKKTISRRPQQGSKTGTTKKLWRKARKLKYRTPGQLEQARKRAILRLQLYLRRVKARQFRAQMQRNQNLTRLRKIKRAEARLKSEKAKLSYRLGKTGSAIDKNQRLYLSLVKQINLLSRSQSSNIKAARRSLRRAAATAARRKFMSQDMRSINGIGKRFTMNNARKQQIHERTLRVDSEKTSAQKVHKPKPMPTKTQPNTTKPSTRVDL